MGTKLLASYPVSLLLRHHHNPMFLEHPLSQHLRMRAALKKYSGGHFLPLALKKQLLPEPKREILCISEARCLRGAPLKAFLHHPWNLIIEIDRSIRAFV